MSKAQIARTLKAIDPLIPQDGTPISLADIRLRAGEGLGSTFKHMTDSGKFVIFLGDHDRHYIRRQ